MRPHLVAVLLVATGCATPYFTGQTGRVTPHRAVRVEVGAAYGVATSAIDILEDTRDAARLLKSSDCVRNGLSAKCYRQGDLAPVLDGALQIALVTPIATYSELSVRYGLLDGLDVGGHLGTGAVRLDAGVQLFGPHDAAQTGWAGALFAGWNHHTGNAASDLVEKIRGEASRDDFDLLAVVGHQFREIGHVYVGGRYMLSRWKLALVPDLPILYDSGEIQEGVLGTDDHGLIHQVGGVLGGALGYRYVFVGAEINLVRYSGEARLLFQQHRFSGLAAMPAVYVYAQF